jgi:hypothetical protein
LFTPRSIQIILLIIAFVLAISSTYWWHHRSFARQRCMHDRIMVLLRMTVIFFSWVTSNNSFYRLEQTALGGFAPGDMRSADGSSLRHPLQTQGRKDRPVDDLTFDDIPDPYLFSTLNQGFPRPAIRGDFCYSSKPDPALTVCPAE